MSMIREQNDLEQLGRSELELTNKDEYLNSSIIFNDPRLLLDDSQALSLKQSRLIFHYIRRKDFRKLKQCLKSFAADPPQT